MNEADGVVDGDAGNDGDPAVDRGPVDHDGMIEPVHWGARLGVAPDAVYTEVGGTAVAVLAEHARIVQLTGDMAALVSRLDGRPVRDALAGLLDVWDDTERRRVIELLRRCKTLGLLRDVPPGTPPRPVDWSTAARPRASVDVRATIEPARQEGPAGPTGPAARADAPPVDDASPDAPAGASADAGTVRIVLAAAGPDAPDPGAPVPVVDTGRCTILRGDHDAVTVRAGGAAHEVTGFVLPPDESAAGLLAVGSVGSRRDGDRVGASPSDTFGVLVESVDPVTQLRDPAVIETCALLAEAVPAIRRAARS